MHQICFLINEKILFRKSQISQEEKEQSSYSLTHTTTRVLTIACVWARADLVFGDAHTLQVVLQRYMNFPQLWTPPHILYLCHLENRPRVCKEDTKEESKCLGFFLFFFKKGSFKLYTAEHTQLLFKLYNHLTLKRSRLLFMYTLQLNTKVGNCGIT